MKKRMKKAAIFLIVAALTMLCVSPAYASRSEFRNTCDEATDPISNAIVYDLSITASATRSNS